MDRGRTFRLPWVSVTGFTPKGWEDAVVRWYRPFTFTTEWGSKPLASRNIPQWCYDADAWVRAKHVTDQTYDAVRRAARYFGQGLGVHGISGIITPTIPTIPITCPHRSVLQGWCVTPSFWGRV